MILEGRFDLGYIRCPLSLPDGIEGVRLSDEGFVLALPADSWLNRLTVINSAHLQNENFILPEQVVGTLQAAAQGDFVPKLGAQPGGLVAVIALVSLGQGWRWYRSRWSAMSACRTWCIGPSRIAVHRRGWR
jgi:DNA-binding transcriptional LysR family regulator